jgi:hypothetical protein
MKQEHKKALKTLVFAQSFVEALDDFGGSTAFKHQLKQKGSTAFKHQLKQKGLSFCKEMDKFLNTVYENGSTDSSLINLVERCQQAIDEVIINEVEVIE